MHVFSLDFRLQFYVMYELREIVPPIIQSSLFFCGGGGDDAKLKFKRSILVIAKQKTVCLK